MIYCTESEFVNLGIDSAKLEITRKVYKFGLWMGKCLDFEGSMLEKFMPEMSCENILIFCICTMYNLYIHYSIVCMCVTIIYAVKYIQ